MMISKISNSKNQNDEVKIKYCSRYAPRTNIPNSSREYVRTVKILFEE